MTTGFLFGTTYSLTKLAVSNFTIWILVGILLPSFFIFTWASVLAKNTAKVGLATVEMGSKPKSEDVS